MKGNLIMLKMILKHPKSDPNSRGRYGYTPLHVAAVYDYPEMIHLLLQHKADINAQVQLCCDCSTNGSQDSDGETPLHRASLWQCIDSMKVLLWANASTKIRDKQGRNAFDRAQVQHCCIDRY